MRESSTHVRFLIHTHTCCREAAHQVATPSSTRASIITHLVTPCYVRVISLAHHKRIGSLLRHARLAWRCVADLLLYACMCTFVQFLSCKHSSQRNATSLLHNPQYFATCEGPASEVNCVLPPSTLPSESPTHGRQAVRLAIK